MYWAHMWIWMCIMASANENVFWTYTSIGEESTFVPTRCDAWVYLCMSIMVQYHRRHIYWATQKLVNVLKIKNMRLLNPSQSGLPLSVVSVKLYHFNCNDFKHIYHFWVFFLLSFYWRSGKLFSLPDCFCKDSQKSSLST